jgi:hypothetical protein
MPFLKRLMGLEPKLGMCNWRSHRNLYLGQQDCHRKAKNGSKMLNWKTYLGACSWSLVNLHDALKVFLLLS